MVVVVTGQCSGDYGRIFGCSGLYRLLPICLIISSYHDLMPGLAGAGWGWLGLEMIYVF